MPKQPIFCYFPPPARIRLSHLSHVIFMHFLSIGNNFSLHWIRHSNLPLSDVTLSIKHYSEELYEYISYILPKMPLFFEHPLRAVTAHIFSGASTFLFDCSIQHSTTICKVKVKIILIACCWAVTHVKNVQNITFNKIAFFTIPT